MTEGPVPFGEAAWLIGTGSVEGAHRLARVVRHEAGHGRAPAGTATVTVGFANVVVGLGPGGSETTAPAPDPEGWEAWLTRLVADAGAGRGPESAEGGPPEPPARTVEVPVAFDGPDLGSVADRLGLAPEVVVGLLTSTELTVAFLGFSPGFPYLVGLPPALAGLERRPRPRTSVPAGSVAVAGGFAAIYPTASPGGWHLLGRTGVALFDPGRPPFALLRAGDRVRFRAGASTGAADRGPEPGTVRRPLSAGEAPALEVRDPGLCTLVQDGGRSHLVPVGVPGSGPADPVAMALANRLAGNPERAAALEITARGPALRAGAAAAVTVVGADLGAVAVTVDGHPVPDRSVVPVEAGQVVAVGNVGTGLRAYLAVAGGLATPEVAGSRASDVLGNLGPGPLRTGDRLALAPPVRPRGAIVPADPRVPPDRRWTVRTVVGPHRFPPDVVEAFLAAEWVVGRDANRVGLRLAPSSGTSPLAPEGGPSPAGPTASCGMVTGAVQVPPDGNPLVLLPDHATVGGYPVIATVIRADVGLLGQMAPGDRVAFSGVSLAEARSQARARARMAAGQVVGWHPTVAGT